jgi:hypothetical protein
MKLVPTHGRNPVFTGAAFRVFAERRAGDLALVALAAEVVWVHEDSAVALSALAAFCAGAWRVASCPRTWCRS